MYFKNKFLTSLAAVAIAAAPAISAAAPSDTTSTIASNLTAPASASSTSAHTPQPADQVITRYTFRNVAKIATPAVVNIKIKSNIVLGSNSKIPPGYGLDEEMRQYLERLFDSESWNLNPRYGEEYKYARSGSGVIIRDDGYIVTSEHVIGDVQDSDIEVSLPDGRTFSSVEVVGTDSLTDLAVIKVNDEGTSNLPHLEWGDSEQMQVGDHVVAVGNPLDFTSSVSEGIISAKHRTINKTAIEDLMQTTAMINPGNSGGALVDLDGKLIGINMAIATSTGMWSGLGFAIPSKTVKTVAEQIINKGKALRGYLGIRMETITIGLAKYLGYANDYGIVVEDVTAGTAAEKAGLQHYDIIASVNGNKVASLSDMHQNIGNLPVGATVNLEVWRDEGDGKLKQLTVPVVLGERPDDKSLEANGGKNRKGPSLPGTKPDDKLLGMKLLPSPDGHGMEVKEVNPKSPVETAGVQPGDVILEVNRKTVNSLTDFQEALKATNTGSHLLYIQRNGTAMLQMVPGN
jgi:serine protease Do